jgi:hypothetical protein
LAAHNKPGLIESERTVPPEPIHDIVRRQTDAALAGIRTDVENLERLYATEKEKTIGNSYEVRRAKEILEELKEHVGALDTAVEKLTDSISDLPLMRKLLYYPVGLVLTGFMLWLLSKSGWGVSK